MNAPAGFFERHSKGLEIDFETRSTVDIKTHGAYLYFECPHAKALIASYRINGGPWKRWRYGSPCPADIREHVEAGGVISAHNASFERLLWWRVLTPRNGWPLPKIEQFRCTAVMAAAMGLPRALGNLGAALGLNVQKNKDGTRLIRKFCVPRRARKDEDPSLIYWNEPEDHPEDFAKFEDYCDDDTKTAAEADARMVPLSDDLQQLYTIDQRINDRGVRLDRTTAIAALKMAEKAKLGLDRDMRKATGGAVGACSQVAKLTAWVREQGIEIPSMAKAEIEELLELDDLPAHVRRAVELRQEAAKTSVSKLKAFLNRVSADGMIRGAFLFMAAGTGRWSSVGAQLHNLPRPRKEFGDAHIDLQQLFETFRLGDPEHLKLMYGDVLGRTLFLISDALRGFLWAKPGYDLVVADYSGIEGAVAAWFAGEHWKVEALHGLIADDTLPDMYRRAAAGIFNTTTDEITKKDLRRQVGKVSELSLQYQGGVGAFRSMSRNYSLKIEPVYDAVWPVASEERREKAEKRYDLCVLRGDPTTKQLSRKAWLAAELVKVGWRATHPAICDAWKLLENGIREAIENPGQPVQVLKVTYLVTQGFLWCKLPSGRCLAYGAPKLKDQVWVKRTGVEASEVIARDLAQLLQSRGECTIEGPAKSAATALGVNSVTKKWERFALYGGLAFENIVQAIAMDLLAVGIRKAEAAGYPVNAHVHDEIIAQMLKGTGDVAEFERLICELEPWAEGLPLSASGWRGKRYRKD